jgi:hypothetical protein
VTVDLDSLLNRPGAVGVGGEVGWAGPLEPEACRRLACDGAITRVLVARHPGRDQRPEGGCADPDPRSHADHDPSSHADHGPGNELGLQDRLRQAMLLLPPVLGGAPPAPGRGPQHPGRPARPTGRPDRP